MTGTKSGDTETAVLRRVLGDTYGLSDGPDLDRICADASVTTIAAGKTLLHQGEPANDMHILLRGRMRAIVRSDDRLNVVGDIGTGETIGELGFVTGRTRGADVVALRDSVVATLARPAVEGLIAAKPDFAFTITRLVAERFERAAQQPSRVPAPRCVAIVALTPDLDARDCAEALGEAAAGFRRYADVVSRADLSGSESLQASLERTEADASGQVFLSIGAHDEPAWRDACVAQADELILFAHAAQIDHIDPGALAMAKRAVGGDAVFSKRVTLAIIQPWDTHSPRNTAAWLDAVPANRHVHCAGVEPHGLARLARIVTGRARGFVMSGGGARGFAHIGACKALAEFGIQPEMLGGTSFGAIVCCWLSMGLEGDELVDEARRTFVDSYNGKLTSDYNWLPLVSLVKGKRARAAAHQSIARMAGHDGAVGIEDSWINTFIVASNYTTISEVIIERGDYAPNLMASFAIPGALPPVLQDGNVLYDGGCFNNFPVDVMAARGAGSIIGIDLSADRGRRIDAEEVPSTAALLMDMRRPRKKRRYRFPGILETLTNAAFISAIARQRDMRKQTDLLVRPRLKGVGMLQWTKFDQAVRQGYDQTRAMLEAMPDAELERLQ
ncbi:MAG: cyclic nucleotide-binding and patatin-like phospholipase domain-containing protein [Pseudomonadota bacterium]